MSKRMTLNEKFRAVLENDALRDEYHQEMINRKITWSRTGCKVNGKKVGRQKFSLAQMYAAQHIYDLHHDQQ